MLINVFTNNELTSLMAFLDEVEVVQRMPLMSEKLFWSWCVAYPVTYVLGAIHTAQQSGPIVWKIATILTLDALFAAFWPVTWVIWGFACSAGAWTPICLLFR